MKTNLGITHYAKEASVYYCNKLTVEDLEKFLLDICKEVTKPTPYTLQFDKYLITGTDRNAVFKKWAELYKEIYGTDKTNEKRNIK